MIINYALNGVRKVPTFDHILIQPYARCVCNASNTWLTNDISAYPSDVSMSMTSNSFVLYMRPQYQLLVYFRMYAVYTDGAMHDLIDFVADGHTVSCSLQNIPGGGFPASQNVARIFDSNASYSYTETTNDPKTYTISCPSSNTVDWIIKGYDNGTDISTQGAILYKLAGTTGDYGRTTTTTINSFTVDGVVVPFTLSSDWGDR